MNHDPPYVVLVGLTYLFHYFYYYFCYADVMKPTEKQLMIELHNTVANKWHAIGTFLEISGGQLNIIADRHRGDPQKCLMDMLSGWLQRINPPATWSDIAGAVEFTGRPDVAQQIRQKYCQASYQPQLLPQPPQQQTMLPYLQSSQIATSSALGYWYGPPGTHLQQPPHLQQQPPLQTGPTASSSSTAPDSSQPHLSSSAHAQQQLPLMSGHPDFFPTQDKEVIVPDGGGEPFERYEAYPPGAIAEVKLSFATVQPDKSNKLSDNQHRELYEMRERPHGIAVIINNEEFETLSLREGTHIDEKNLIQTFRYLGYTVEVHRDKSSQQIIDIFEDTRKRDHSKYDSFVCCILTHGKGREVFGCDGKLVKIETISSKMNGKACPTLAGKPKMFFIQACRGKKRDCVTTDSDENERDPFFNPVVTDSDERVPIESDFFFGYATPLNYVSFRDMDNGSWYVTELCRVLCTYSTSTTLGDMHKRVNNEVSSRYQLGSDKQISEVRNRLRKAVYFCC